MASASVMPIRPALRLVAPVPNPGTVNLLKTLLAKAQESDLVGVVVCAVYRDGRNDSFLGGQFHDEPKDALQAVMRTAWSLAQPEDVDG